ncbi:MAG: hypothetical protein JNN15_12835 [Blastocatellia bacterium]|nr:hypothetical protein [Blastocatellia bacterium]
MKKIFAKHPVKLIVASLIFAFLIIAPKFQTVDGVSNRANSDFFGVSGSNVRDRNIGGSCCTGTLGSLITDGSRRYILSNNHVLARLFGLPAGPTFFPTGEDVTQPGLADNACQNAEIVADLTTAIPFSAVSTNTVDAAIAELRPGAMRSDGSILGIGTISSVVKPASVGLTVTKSGRTTGITTGRVTAINVTSNVQYQSCENLTITQINFSNAIAIQANSGAFSAGGDSGSLIVTNNSCRQPVGLLFAGNSTTTLANPAATVLSRLGSRLGRQLSFVGNACSASTSAADSLLPEIPSESVSFATDVMNDNVEKIMKRPAVLAMGVGASETDSTSPAIVIFVDKTKGVTPKLPKRMKGLEVKIEYTEPFIAQ